MRAMPTMAVGDLSQRTAPRSIFGFPSTNDSGTILVKAHSPKFFPTHKINGQCSDVRSMDRNL